MDQRGWKVRNVRVPFVLAARTAATLSLHSPFYFAFPGFLCVSQLLDCVALPVAASSSVGTGDGGLKCHVPVSHAHGVTRQGGLSPRSV